MRSYAEKEKEKEIETDRQREMSKMIKNQTECIFHTKTSLKTRMKSGKGSLAFHPPGT